MARAIWSGTISFGLLNVPVKLYSAVARRGISLREIRESDGARIRHRRVAEGTDEEVPYDEIVKAFEITPDRYVPLSKDEMAALAPEKTRAIEVQDFVDLDEIDPIYFDSPYYLGPAEGAEKAYSLLAAAMEESGKVAIARFVFRNKEHLAAIRARRRRPDPDHDALRRRGRAARRARGRAARREAEGRQERGGDGRAADRVADHRVRPGAYRDEYREQLLALIERKAEGKESSPRRRPRSRKATKAPDLMAALEESIAAVKASARASRRRSRQAESAAKKARPKRKPKTLRPRPRPKPRNSPWPRAARSRSTAVS